MFRFQLFVAAMFMAAAPGFAGSELESLDTADASRGWEGIGLLDVAGGRLCTGSLIADNLVLTAGHCVFDRNTGHLAAPDKIRFMPGWRSGRAAAYRGARRLAVHPRYVEDSEQRSYDLALIELDQPIHNGSVTPFATGSQLLPNQKVGVISYAFDRSESPSIEPECKVLGHANGAPVLDCDVDFGSSGAPVFDLSGDEPRIVSVVSAKGELGDQKISIGTNLEQPLAELRAFLGQSAYSGTGPAGSASRVGIVSTGSKSVRPPGSSPGS